MLVEISNLKKYFPVKKGFLGKERSVVKAVDDVSLSLSEGENLSLVGESGSGKSTLARMLMRLIPVTDGNIIFNGEDITNLPRKKMIKHRRNMQMVFQDPYSSLDPRFTIRRVMSEATTLDEDRFKIQSVKEKRILELLNAVGLDGNVLDRYPHEFSGGERQRIAIARALMVHPKLLILDEAVSSLDVIIQEELIELLMNLQKNFNLTYLFISHNLRIVKKFSNRIAVMYNGKIVEMGLTEQIIGNPQHPYTKELLLAAIEYKSQQTSDVTVIDSSAKLVEFEKDHFVLK